MSDEILKEYGEAILFLMELGYRKCDCPACNCGSFHQVKDVETLQSQLAKAKEEIQALKTENKGISDHADRLIEHFDSCDVGEQYNSWVECQGCGVMTKTFTDFDESSESWNARINNTGEQER